MSLGSVNVTCQCQHAKFVKYSEYWNFFNPGVKLEDEGRESSSSKRLQSVHMAFRCQVSGIR